MVEYDSKWKKSFAEEKRKIKNVLKKDAIKIQHIGSTSITGISAKPIIDIAVIVPTLQKAEEYKIKLKKIGYKPKDYRRTDRLFFTKGPEEKRTHYLHIGVKGNDYIENAILFSNCLRKHKDISEKYNELKRRLEKKYSNKRKIYTKKKGKFITEVIKKYSK